MNDFDPDEHVARTRDDWNNAAAAWEKWDDWLEKNMGALNEALLDAAGVAHGQRALDLGSGSGYPSLIAARRVGEGGSVEGLDLSEKMLEVARRKAEREAIRNVTFTACNVGRLPFDANSFDAATSRFCLMFLPDVVATLTETHRVLKPGGRFAALVWSDAARNPSFRIPLDILGEFVDMPKPAPGLPGLFALAPEGKLAGLFEKAGFSDITVREKPVIWRYSDIGEYARSFREMAAPFRKAYDGLTADQREKVKLRIIESATPYFEPSGEVVIEGMALMLSGSRATAK